MTFPIELENFADIAKADAPKIKLNYALITLLKFMDSIKAQVGYLACNCRMQLMNFFLKEIRKFIYESMSEFVVNKQIKCTCDKAAKAILKIIPRVSKDIEQYNATADQKIDMAMIDKFMELKRQMIQISRLKIVDACKSLADDDDYSKFGEQLVDIIIQFTASTFGDATSVYAPSCLVCDFNKEQKKFLAARYVIIVTDFFENEQWLRNRLKIVGPPDALLKPTIVLDFEYSINLNDRKIHNIIDLKNMGYNVQFINAKHHHLLDKLNSLLGESQNARYSGIANEISLDNASVI